MSNPEKKGQPKRSKKSTEPTDQQLIDNLAKSVLYVLRQELHKEHEPFETYASQLKVRFHGTGKNFSDRCLQGYSALMEALQVPK